MVVLPLSWLLMPRGSAGGRSSSPRASCSTRAGTGASASSSRSRSRGTTCSRAPSTAAATRAPASSSSSSRSPGTSGCSGYFKYYDFFVTSTNNLFAFVGHRRPARGALDPAPGRHLLLHVHGDQLRRGRLPRRLRAGRARDVRRLPLVLPAPRRRADRAARRAHPAVPVAARPALRRHVAGVLPHRHRALHEGRDREPPRGEHRRRGLRRAEPALVARGARRGSTRTPCRSTPTSSGTRTSRSGSRSCSASRSRRTSTRPTRPTSITDFWRRWHMTLSRWLRDYLYIPLGGNRGGTLLTYRNLMLTMLIGGLWHGAGWTFVVWGGIHGLRARRRALVAEPTRLRRAAVDARAARVAPLCDVPGRLLRVDLLPLGLVRGRLGSHRAPVHGLGRAVSARHRGRRSPRSPSGSARSTSRVGSRSRSWRASRGSRSRRRPPCSSLRSSSSTPWGPRAWHRSSTSSSDGDARDIQTTATRRARRTADGACTPPARRSSSRSPGSGVALLLNAPGLHKSATIQPEGWKRDVALAVTGPLETVAGALLPRPVRGGRSRLRSAARTTTRSTRPSRRRATERRPRRRNARRAAEAREVHAEDASSGSGSPATRSWSFPGSRCSARSRATARSTPRCDRRPHRERPRAPGRVQLVHARARGDATRASRAPSSSCSAATTTTGS